MPYNPQIHHRRSIRLKGYDYTREGLYFITICCHKRVCRFGTVVNGEMILNEFGIIAYTEWINLAERFGNFELDVFQVMPNHMHGIISLVAPARATLAVAPDTNRNNTGGAGLTPAPNVIDAEIKMDEAGLNMDIGICKGADSVAKAGAAEISGYHMDVENILGRSEISGDLRDSARVAASDDEIDNCGSGAGAGFGMDAKKGSGKSLGESLRESLGESVRATARVARTAGEGKAGEGKAEGEAGKAAAISDIVGAYKSLVANGCLKIFKSRNEIMGKLWHRNYYEHIIRDARAYERISEYIINNPAKWQDDKFYLK